MQCILSKTLLTSSGMSDGENDLFYFTYHIARKPNSTSSTHDLSPAHTDTITPLSRFDYSIAMELHSGCERSSKLNEANDKAIYCGQNITDETDSDKHNQQCATYSHRAS